VFDSLETATKAMVHIEKTFIPNPKNVKQYNKLFKDVYAKLYPKLKGIYKKLKYF
jgi:sugar (pentulose or hexulose) kinase